jgi:hypothetical protein
VPKAAAPVARIHPRECLRSLPFPSSPHDHDDLCCRGDGQRPSASKSCHPSFIEEGALLLMSIPDNLQGAFTISIIDFVLSFVIISGIGVVLALLPLVNRWKIDESKLKQGH